jgi:hypothetical protein
VVIPSNTLTQFLIPGIVIVQKGGKASWLFLNACVKDISEKFKCVGNYYNIRTIFTTEPTLWGSFFSNRPERNSQQTAHCSCNIPCECGRSYVGETGRPLAMWLYEHRHDLRESPLEYLKVVQPANEKGHRVG